MARSSRRLATPVAGQKEACDNDETVYLQKRVPRQEVWQGNSSDEHSTEGRKAFEFSTLHGVWSGALMGVRRRAIANRLMHWLAIAPVGSENLRTAQMVLKSPSRLGRYLAYHLRRMQNNG